MLAASSRISTAVIVAFFSVSMIQATPRVDITISPPVHPKWGQRMRVTCLVSGITDPDYFRLKVKLLCPVVSGSVPCFQDCKTTCSPGMGCSSRQSSLLSGISCSSFKGTDKLQFDFEFPYKDDAYAGDYMCQYYGRPSARVSIPKPSRPPTLPPKTTVKTTTTTTTKAPATKQPPVVVVPPVKPKPEEPTSRVVIVPRGPCVNRPTSKPAVDVHRERILVVVMVLLFVSLAVNVIIIVRCMVKIHYAKYPHKKRMSSLLCLPMDRPPSAVPHPPIHYAASLGLGEDAGGSDSTYSMPTSAFVPMNGGHGRANTLPVIPSTDSHQNIVFIPVIANSLNTLQSASHPRLNTPLPDNVSMGIPASGAAGRREHPPREHSHRLSTSSIPLRVKPPLPGAHPLVGSQPLNGIVVEAEFDPEQETLID